MSFLPFALSLSSTFTKIGAIAAFAALMGIAILSLLVFSQARELKRLREWAGRAPERAADLEQRVSSAAAVRVQQQPPAAQMARPVARAAPIPAAAAASATRVLGEPVAPAGVPVPVAQAPAAGVAAGTPAIPAPGAPTPPPGAQPATPPGGAPSAAPPVPGQPPATVAAPPGQPPMPAQPTPAVTRSPVPVQPSAGNGPPASAPPLGAPTPPARPLPGAPMPTAPDPRSPMPAPAPAPATAAASAAASRAPIAPAPAPPSTPAAATPAGQLAQDAAAPRRPAPPVGRAPGTPVAAQAADPRTSRQSIPPPLEGRSIYAAKRSRGRAVALMVVGVVVVAAAVAVVLTSLGGSSSPKHASTTTTTAGRGATPKGHAVHKAAKPAPKTPALSPAETNVAVLNATEAEGLASRTASALQQNGYSQAAAHFGKPPGSGQVSVVEYASGHQAEAEGVAHSLSVSHVLPIEAAVTALAGSAGVVVIVGSDREHETSSP